MKKALLLSVIATFVLSTPLAAQAFRVGFNLGAAQTIEDGVDVRFREAIREVWFGAELEPTTFFKIKVGQTDIEDRTPIGIPGLPREGRIDYVDALVEYRFYEVFGSTGLFLGPGFYRQRLGTTESSDWGLHGGVNGEFPITRRFAAVIELGYHWISNDERTRFLSAMGGFRVGF
jgi:hypothetical protein